MYFFLNCDFFFLIRNVKNVGNFEQLLLKYKIKNIAQSVPQINNEVII